MATITADMIKVLRERTGVGMGKCKEALESVGGDMEKAIDHLRKLGIASAVKKEGRETKEGVVAAKEDAHHLAMIEVNSETDFVAQNEKFKTLVAHLLEDALKHNPKDVEAFMNTSSSHDSSLTIDAYRALVMQSLGENIKVKRLHIMKKEHEASYGIYSHMGGKILCVVEILGAPGMETLAREIAMHVAAESPDYLDSHHIPQDVIQREKDIAASQVVGKPAQIADKIIEGKLKSFFDQVCLLNQKFIKNTAISISELLAEEGKKHGKTLSIKRYMRWTVGE
jgi:elongation factor Ts